MVFRTLGLGTTNQNKWELDCDLGWEIGFIHFWEHWTNRSSLNLNLGQRDDTVTDGGGDQPQNDAAITENSGTGQGTFV